MKFTLEGKYHFRDELSNGWWEVYWPGHGFIAIDGTTQKEIEDTWPKQKAEIISQLLGEDL